MEGSGTVDGGGGANSPGTRAKPRNRLFPVDKSISVVAAAVEGSILTKDWALFVDPLMANNAPSDGSYSTVPIFNPVP